MNKTALNAQLVTTRLKRGFYFLKSVECGRSDVRKNLVELKSISSLIFLLVRLVFSCCEFIAVFRQVQAWDTKSAGNAGWDGRRAGAGWERARFLKLLRGGSRQKISTHAGLYCRNIAAREKLSAGQWCWHYVSLVNVCSVVNTFQLKFQLRSTDIFIIIVPQPVTFIILHLLWFTVMIPVQSNI